MAPNNIPVVERLQGLVVGAALGDALGLPSEGLTRQRIARLWPGPLTHRLIAGRGMGSDDTEHLVFSALAILKSQGDTKLFQTTLARHLRWWLLLLPAGVGLATARALGKLWLGWKPGRNGVFSAGNGPGMRSSVIGAVLSGSPDLITPYVTVSTRLTHTDPKALTGALALAHSAAWIRAADAPLEELFLTWESLSMDREWRNAVSLIRACHGAQASVSEFAARFGCTRRVSGYIYHSVPIALYAWLHHRGNYSDTLTEVVRCGGDTDTVAAMAGALAGLDVGIHGIPAPWRKGWCDWPITQEYLLDLGRHLAAFDPSSASPTIPVKPQWGLVLPRNLLFLFVVLCHGFRRLLPPY